MTSSRNSDSIFATYLMNAIIFLTRPVRLISHTRCAWTLATYVRGIAIGCRS